MERVYYPREHGGGFIWKLAGIAFILSVTAMTLYRLGVLDALLSPPGVPLPAPTPIVRVVDPYRDVTRPVEAPPTVMPAQAAPAVSAPQAAPGAAEPTPAVRQIIVVKSTAPGAAPVVIDRGTKRRSP